MNEFISGLKQRLTKPLPGNIAHQQLFPTFRSNFDETIDTTKIDAGVLILIYPNKSGIYNIPFIKRPPNTGIHSSQVSFPGGRFEETDKNFETTALRETQEEIGIDVSTVEIIGKLSQLYIPISKYLVHPFVGITSKTPEFYPETKEVDYIITYPIKELLNLTIKNKILVREDVNYNIPYYEINNEDVWGATSMILCEFIEILKRV